MLPEEASCTEPPLSGISGGASGIDCEAHDGMGNSGRGTLSEDAIEVASDDEVMGQTPPPRSSSRRSQASSSASQQSPALDEPMEQTPQVAVHSGEQGPRRPYPRGRGEPDTSTGGKPGDNACHLAAALRLLAHSDWPPGVSFKQPLHVLLRHVAKGGRQNEGSVQQAMHQELTTLYPTEPFAQQDAMFTLMKTVDGLPAATQDAIHSCMWVDEACLAHQCRQADTIHSQRAFAHIGNHAQHPPRIFKPY